MRILMALLVVAACDEGQVRPPVKPPAPVAPTVTLDAGPPAELEVLGKDPATMGNALDGLALGQAIDQPAAQAILKQREIQGSAYVRRGHLVSIRLWNGGPLPSAWPETRSLDGEHWFDPVSHQHATQTITEQGTWMQFDLEVPLEQWFESIVRFDLVKSSLEDLDRHAGPGTWSNTVDGHSHVSWTESALVGAASATEVSVRESVQYRSARNGEWLPVPGSETHGLYVGLDAPPAIYDAIAQHLTEQFGTSVRKKGAAAWNKSKLQLTHTEPVNGIEHIELEWDR